MGKNSIREALKQHNSLLHIISIQKAIEKLKGKRSASQGLGSKPQAIRGVPLEYINSAKIFDKFKDL